MKRFFALVLALALMITCFAGCHEKGETAVTVDGVNFTSGYYACALFFADMQARSIVDEELAEQNKTSANIKYWDYKVEKTDYVKWVKDAALDLLKNVAVIRNLCEENKVTLSKENAESAAEQANQSWEANSDLLEANGVGKETFVKYIEDEFLINEYFDYLYGKDGKDAISGDKLSKQLKDNYLIANVLSVSFSEIKDAEKKEIREKFVAYETALKDGSKTFEQIYLEYNQTTAEEHKHDEPEDGEIVPKDYHASVLTEGDTHYDTAKKMAVGEVKLITLEEDAGLVLLVKKDIMEDPYYITNFDTMLRQEISGEDFNKDIEKLADKTKYNVNKSSVNQFDVKKIVHS